MKIVSLADKAALLILVCVTCCLFMGSDVCDQDNCSGGWHNSETILGGIECEHGPEYDSDCKGCYEFSTGTPIKIANTCCENNAGVTCDVWTDNNSDGDFDFPGEFSNFLIPGCSDANACKCFDCTAATVDQCEIRFLRYLTTCGIYPNNPTGECATYLPDGADPVTDPLPMRIDIPQVFDSGTTCTGSGTNQHKTKYVCGGNNISYADCTSSTACKDDPDFSIPAKGSTSSCASQYVRCGKRRHCGV